MEIYKKLSSIQNEVKATKDLFNAFGKYSYRSAESILQSVKPVAQKNGAVVTLSDEMVMIGERYYIKATARVTDVDTGEYAETHAYAREPVSKKGMDDSQLTGSTSSYARKYALSGLLGLDDNKDADSMDNRDVPEVKYITDEQRKLLAKLSTEKGKSSQEMGELLKKRFGVNNSRKLTEAQFQLLMDELMNELK